MFRYVGTFLSKTQLTPPCGVFTRAAAPDEREIYLPGNIADNEMKARVKRARSVEGGRHYENVRIAIDLTCYANGREPG